MRRIAIYLLLVCSATAVGVPAPKPTKQDLIKAELANLQGTWKPIYYQRDGVVAPLTEVQSITIKGTNPSGYAPKHVAASGKIVSLFDVAVKPTFDPAPPAGQLPLISEAKDRVSVVSPSTGGCALVFSFTLNSGEVSVRT